MDWAVRHRSPASIAFLGRRFPPGQDCVDRLWRQAPDLAPDWLPPKDLNLRMEGMTSLHNAMERGGSAELIRKLAALGAEPFAIADGEPHFSSGDAMIMIARHGCDPEGVGALASLGLDPLSGRDHLGNDALQVAMRNVRGTPDGFQCVAMFEALAEAVFNRPGGRAAIARALTTTQFNCESPSEPSSKAARRRWSGLVEVLDQHEALAAATPSAGEVQTEPRRL